MERGLYIAASGMLAEQVRQDQIANDLANASTPGYKADRSAQASFADMLLQNSQTGADGRVPEHGRSRRTHRDDLEQGPLQQTGDPLDIALQGDGFLAVSTRSGTRYTRNGQLSLDGQGRLVDRHRLPRPRDERPADHRRRRRRRTISISQGGAVSVGGRTVGTLGVVSLTGADQAGRHALHRRAGRPAGGDHGQQGFLEGSGVEPARAMVDMIVSLRAYESSQRVIHAIDDTLGRATTRWDRPPASRGG